MQALRTDILPLLRKVWRHRWVAAAVSVLVCSAGWTVTAVIPNRYEADAKVYVDTDTLLRPLLQGLTVQANVDQQIAIMQRTLLSRPILEQVARVTDLDLRVTNELEKEQLFQEMMRQVSIKPQGQKNLFSIAYTHSEPETARRVVQSLLTIFVESNLGNNRRDMQSVSTFLDKQIADYERQLQETDRKIAEFKQTHMDVLPSSGSFAATTSQAQAALQQATKELDDAVIRRDTLRKQIASIPRTIEIETAPQVIVNQAGQSVSAEVQALQQRLQEAKRTLSALELQYTARHPDVLAAKRLVESLASQLEAEQAKPAAPEAQAAATRRPKSSVPNPVYEQLQIRLLEQEGIIAGLEQRVQDATRDLERIRTMGRRGPEAEAQLLNLTRDYDIIRKQYESLLTRRESARLAQAVDTTTENVQFRVIEPPRTPNIPAGPNRVLFIVAALAAGIGAGIAYAFLLAQLDDTIGTIERLRAAFDLPVLGSIARSAPTGMPIGRLVNNAAFASVCALIFAGAGAMYLMVSRLPLDLDRLKALLHV